MCRFQRGQVPPKREKGKASPAKRLEMLPAASTRSMKKGTPRAPVAAERGQPVRDLLDAGAEQGAEPVDVVAVLLRRLEEGRVGHHDRAGGIIGEAHVEQAPGRRVGRRGGLDHLLEQRPELDQGELVGEAEGAAFGPEQRREQQPLAVEVVMLAGAVEQLGRHDPRLDAEAFLEPPPQRLGDGQRVAERAGQRLRRLLEIGEMVALGLDMVAHPGLRARARARSSSALAGGCGAARPAPRRAARPRRRPPAHCPPPRPARSAARRCRRTSDRRKSRRAGPRRCPRRPRPRSSSGRRHRPRRGAAAPARSPAAGCARDG